MLLVSSAGTAGAAYDSEEWNVKHRPKTVDQLAVAKLKVQEIRDWLQAQTRSKDPGQQAASGSRLLLLTGKKARID